MQGKKLILFVRSLVLLPIISVSMPITNVTDPNNINNIEDIITISKIVFLEKRNTELEFSAYNKDEDSDALTLKAQAKAIDAYYAKHNMPLVGSGMKMATEAKKNNLDWRLIPAISVVESTGGKYSCKKVSNSFLGWGSCRIGFESKEKAIEIVAWNLGGNNPNTSHLYKGKSTSEIIDIYNPPSIVPSYKRKVLKVMDLVGEEHITTDILLQNLELSSIK